jgi:hypothetical protein
MRPRYLVYVTKKQVVLYAPGLPFRTTLITLITKNLDMISGKQDL